MATGTRTITGSILYEPGDAWAAADVIFTLVTGYATTAADKKPTQPRLTVMQLD